MENMAAAKLKGTLVVDPYGGYNKAPLKFNIVMLIFSERSKIWERNLKRMKKYRLWWQCLRCIYIQKTIRILAIIRKLKK